MSDDAKVPLPVPVARVWELTLHERDRVLAKHGPVLVAPLYLHDQLRTYGDARERAARAAAFDDVVAGIRAVQAAYDEQEGRPNVAGSVCSDCIGAVNALRAAAAARGSK